MHQVSLETICPLKAFQLYYCPDNDAKSMVKHFIILKNLPSYEYTNIKLKIGARFMFFFS